MSVALQMGAAAISHWTGDLSFVHSAAAQDGGDDGGGDDGDDGGDDGDDDDDTDGNDPGTPPSAADDLQDSLDDGENTGPREEDCFEQAALRPSWLRPCDDRPARAARPAGLPVVPPSTRQRDGAPRAQTAPLAPLARAEPANALPREIVALRLTPTQLTALEARGFVLLARSPGPLSVGDLFRLEVPSEISTIEALSLARTLAPGAIIDFNHIYRPAQQAECKELFCQQRRAIRWPQPPNECRVEASIGLIDTTVDRNSPALSGQKISVIDGVSAGRPLASNSHGTAITALLVGRSDAPVPGLLPRSEIVTVQAFHQSDAGEDIADSFDIVTAVDTLLKRGLKVINLSFTGPNNRLLAEIVARATTEQSLLVAAAGNRGPTAPVVYPAGYESVVAVTAVGEDLRIYRGANRGKFVDFAAPGVNVQVVSAKVETRFETGTSFAAPFITAALAASRAQQPSASPDALVSALQASATDLGKPGRDPIFGWGLVQVPEICP